MKVCEHKIRRAGLVRQCVKPDGHWGLHVAQAEVPATARRRRGEYRAYQRQRRAFLAEHPRCVFPGGCAHPATEVHHRKGRVGALLLDEKHWSPLCHDHHAYITEHPAWAYEAGMSERRIGGAA